MLNDIVGSIQRDDSPSPGRPAEVDGVATLFPQDHDTAPPYDDGGDEYPWDDSHPYDQHGDYDAQSEHGDDDADTMDGIGDRGDGETHPHGDELRGDDGSPMLYPASARGAAAWVHHLGQLSSLPAELVSDRNLVDENDWWRMLTRHGEHVHAQDSAAADDGSATTRVVEGRLAADDLRHALEQLDDLTREIVVLREVEGMSYDEIAETLEVPVPTVKTRLLRGRRRLGVALEEWRS